jgi:hypothetical protein
MKNIDGLGKLGDVYYSVLMRPMYPNLPSAWADRWHRTPVVWVLAFLNITELVSSFSSSNFWELLEAAPGAAPKDHFLHLSIIKVLLYSGIYPLQKIYATGCCIIVAAARYKLSWISSQRTIANQEIDSTKKQKPQNIWSLPVTRKK